MANANQFPVVLAGAWLGASLFGGAQPSTKVNETAATANAIRIPRSISVPLTEANTFTNDGTLSLAAENAIRNRGLTGSYCQMLYSGTNLGDDMEGAIVECLSAGKKNLSVSVESSAILGELGWREHRLRTGGYCSSICVHWLGESAGGS